VDDAAKPSKLRWGLLPWAALELVVRVLEYGAQKYSPNGWRTVPNGAEVYREACLRHAAAIGRGEWVDTESGLPHAAHLACDCLIFLELSRQHPGVT
jgi:hypothetical protein